LKGSTELKSSIVDAYPSLLKEFGKKTWKLLYRGSRDGFNAAGVHSKSDNRANIVTLIETMKGLIFGGFTPTPWDSGTGYKSDAAPKSFFFTPRKDLNVQTFSFCLNKEVFPQSMRQYKNSFHFNHKTEQTKMALSIYQ
jgi:hypothetical protein